MRILLIEDDKNLSAAMTEQLEQEGYLTDCCYDGEQGLHFALKREFKYDMILLDRMLPVLDGLTVLRAIRREKLDTPVLMMTAMGELDDRIDGLDCGADDYLVKPFYIRELLARIRALTRRPADIARREPPNFFGLTLYSESRRLEYKGQSVMLTPKECALMESFLEQPEKTYSRGELLWRIWGTAVEDSNVDNYIYFLRRHLRQLGCTAVIKTVYGKGYRLEEGV